MDMELEAKGSIFEGRDEKQIILSKRELQQQEMKMALQAQIDEKNRKKEYEKQRALDEERRLEQRIRADLNLQGGEQGKPAAPSFNQNNQTMNVVGNRGKV